MLEQETYKPQWVKAFERGYGRWMPLTPNALSSLKMMTSLMILGSVLFHWSDATVIGLFLLFGVLDYSDGVVARAKDRSTRFGKIYDRFTDYPMLLILGFFALGHLPTTLIATKVALDTMLLVVYFINKRSTRNRLRTSINYIAMLVLLLVYLDVERRFISVEVATALVGLNIAISFIVLLANIGVLHARYVADMLSLSNLACGVASIYMASTGRVDMSLLCLLLGAALDGLDGAAARKFGGTKWGVYSDDVADAVTYGIAPGAILGQVLYTMEGVIVGVLYAVFTISRLIFFTLNKSNSDANYFSGAPSTLGGIIVLASAYVLDGYEVLLGFMVGLVCTLMVSYDTQYRHLGRALAMRSWMKWCAGMSIVVLMVSGLVGGRDTVILVILVGSVAYGFVPMVKHFKNVIGQKRSSS